MKAHAHSSLVFRAVQVVKRYNKLGKALLDYELAFFKSWCAAIDSLENRLNTTLLVKVDDTQLAINWDPHVGCQLHENKCVFCSCQSCSLLLLHHALAVAAARGGS
jgi:hypothetical protein